MSGPMSFSTAPAIRPGIMPASSIATMPPSEVPIATKRFTPAASMSAAMSCA